MTICVNDLGEGFITFPEFQRQLRVYERDIHEAQRQDTEPQQALSNPVKVAPSSQAVPTVVYWIAYEGKGLYNQRGEPLLFESVTAADDFIAEHEGLFGARVFRWATTK